MDTTENSDLAKRSIINFPFLSDLPCSKSPSPNDLDMNEAAEKDDISMNSETSSKNLILKLTETVATEKLRTQPFLNPLTLSNPQTLSSYSRRRLIGG